MARSITLQDLRLDARERAEMPRSKFVSDANLDRYINSSIARVYKMLVAARGQDYYQKEATFTTVGGQQLYGFGAWTPAATDFWQLITVECTDGTFRRTLQPFMSKERARWREYSVPAGYPITVNYVPAPGKLVLPADTFDGIADWEEWVTVDVAMKMLEKEESDISTLAARKAELTQEIEELAPDRDGEWPERVVDVTRADNPWSFSGGVPRYRLFGASGIAGTSAGLEILWGAVPWAY